MDNLNPAATAAPPAAPALRDRKGNVYQPAVSPRLKVLLLLIFVSFAILGATGAYLASISFLNWLRDPIVYTNYAYLCLFLVHVGLGVAMVLPFLAFGIIHYLSARSRKNRLAVKLGLALFASGIVICLTGLALVQLEAMPLLPTRTVQRAVVYWLHVLVPIAAVGLYLWHRHAGPDIKWKYGYAWIGGVAVFVLGMGALHFYNPRSWNVQGSKEGLAYFYPSRARTVDGNFIPEHVLMADQYCLKCHKDAYEGWFHSAHHFSSFNNPAYKFSVKETREVSMKGEGNTKRSRWCAGCHDTVPFFAGKFDDPNYDIDNDPTAQSGITCTTCHAITNVNSTVGNADYTIEEPLHYPFAFSDNAALQWVNNQLVKAKPDFHKKTFLKPFHKSADFCSTCHKVSLPMEVTHYKEWNRGQNHHDPFLLSGVSGGNARAFYYPPTAKERCAECHMPTKESNDFGARDFDDDGKRKIHNHLFLGGNTGLPVQLSQLDRNKDHIDGLRAAADKQAEFLKNKQLRIDLFALREGGTIDGKLLGPIRPELPKLKPGETYLLDVVVRTLGVGHIFSQGTVDSNEIWVDVEATSGGKVIGRNGGLAGPDETGEVDRWAHYVNVHMLDRNGNRINRRNPQDIFTALYDHQIPPGAAHVVHYEFKVPEGLTAPVEFRARLRYRKFDFEYMSIVYKELGKPVPKLPIIDLCQDSVTLPVEGVAAEVPAQKSPIEPAWQRWNDYGIGYFLTADADPKRPGLLQAVQAFEELTRRYPNDKAALANGYLNLARSYERNGELTKAGDMLKKIKDGELPAPPWTVAWFNGVVSAQNGHLDEAIKLFREILDPDKQDRKRKLHFNTDYVVRNELGVVLYKRSQQEEDGSEGQTRFLKEAVQEFQRTLGLDAENLDAHYWLAQAYSRLGESAAGGARPAEAPKLADLEKLTAHFFDPKAPADQRKAAAAELGPALEAFSAKSPDLKEPKLPFITDAIKQARKTFQDDPDAGVRTAAALVLGRLHLAAHAVYKPDDNAKDTTTKKYRETHPAANSAAKALIVYPLQRQGAPGF
ncbi:MAG TPA: multiheme c-type cytochrome [Gemmataceae bacterium]|nr:multiheme c-type cytochrome [Gemmataceae bacterium]